MKKKKIKQEKRLQIKWPDRPEWNVVLALIYIKKNK